MSDPTPATATAKSILGPITPIRCNLTGCHWSCHGVPDKYTDSRAQIIREHMAAEHAPTPEPGTAPADTLRDRIAAAIRAESSRVDDLVLADAVLAALPEPALAVARQILGATNTESAGEAPAPAADLRDRRGRYAAAMALRDGHPEWPVQYEDDERAYLRRADAAMAVADAEQASLRAEAEGLDEALRGAISASEKDGARLRAELAAAPPAPADRAAVLREAADFVGNDDTCDCGGCDSCVPNKLADGLRRLAEEAEYTATPCSWGACEPGGEPCTTHERLMAHAEGDHELCDHAVDEAQQPTPGPVS